MERLKPVLVLNKIDRLITEKKLTKLEAFQRLQTVLEQANAAVALLFSTEVLKGKTVIYNIYRVRSLEIQSSFFYEGILF
jgi:translation elongation factor EF-G